MKLNYLLSLIFYFTYVTNVSAQTLTANVDNTTVPMGEVFTLNLSYDGSDGGSLQPDLSVLDADFRVYSTSSSSQMSFINGKSSHQHDWDIGLMPKKEGKLVIPAISAGKYKTQPLTIEAVAAGTNVVKKDANLQTDNKLAEASKFSVDLAVDIHNPYLQQELNAVLTIRDNVGLHLTAEPFFINTNDWIIKNLKQPQIKDLGNGEREIKFYYALFAQKSGRLEIPAVKVEGFYVSMEKGIDNQIFNQGINGFFRLISMDADQMFGMNKPVELYSKPLQVDVRPIAENYGNYWWLPASDVTLNASWSDNNPVFKVGETVAREITLTAVGVADVQLPEINFEQSSDFKQYPEMPIISSRSMIDEFLAQSVTRVVYIPQKSGQLTLPEIKVQWFNVKTGKIQSSVIPAQNVWVEKNDNVAEIDDNVTLQKNNVTEKDGGSEVYHNKNNNFDRYVVVLTIILSFVLGILISWLLLKSKMSNDNVNNKNKSGWCNLVRNDIKNKDYRALRDNLLAWGNNVFKTKQIANLNDLALAVNDNEFNFQMQKLGRVLYGGEIEQIDAEPILRVIKSRYKKDNGHNNSEPLPKLYK